MSRRALVAAAFAASLACGSSELPPRGQILLYITTDAPLPPAPGDELGPDDPFPLFDRLRIDVFEPGSTAPCADCTREFDVNRTVVGQGHASFGVVPTSGKAGYRARVRLFRGAVLVNGIPSPDSTLDTTVALPAVGTDGLTELTVTLRTQDVAKSLGLTAPIEASPGPAAPGLVGSWPGATRVGCSGAARPDEVCIPGGAYWMGNPLVEGLPSSVGTTSGAQRLVSLSPFFVQTTEVTVATLRAAKLAIDPVHYDPTLRPGCTYSPVSDATIDPLPTTCILWQDARAYCQSRGGNLPSEAQFEYMASGLRGGLYVWGNDEPGCGDAVFGRAPNQECAPTSLPSPPGTGTRDWLRIAETGTPVVDLAGNVQEWTLDTYAPAGPPCWAAGVFHDPLCTAADPDPMTAGYRPVRSGGWPFVGATMRAAARDGIPTDAYRDTTGFRCVRPAPGIMP